MPLPYLHLMLLPLNLVYQSILRKPNFGLRAMVLLTVIIMVRGLAVEHMSSFVYIGSLLTPNARSSADIRRLAQASSAFDSLRGVLVDDSLSFATRRQLYNACVLSVLLYRSECLDATVF